MPGNEERRPAEPDGDQPPSPNQKLKRSLASAADAEPYHLPLTELKSGGIVRVNRARRVLATCADCPAAFVNTGTAWSHSRSARHRVEVDYQVRFAFIPGEVLAELVPQ